MKTLATSFMMFSLWLLSLNAYATIRYVTPTGGGSGTGSWANASNDLQGMIDASITGDEVWVAAGTYKPTQDPFGNSSPTDPRDKTFYVKDGVKIYGGFAGNEGSLAARNIAANPTTLSGDFNGDDVVTGSGSTLSITNNTENAYHVVLASAPSSGGIGVTVDGFSITGGNANSAGSVTVNGNSFSGSSGGGIYTFYGTNTLTNNTLSGNSAQSGGGIYTFYGTNTLTNNTLSDNSATFGGGIFTNQGMNTLTNNTVSGNAASNSGGGIYTYFGTNTLTNNTLSGNSAQVGGGIITFYGTNTLRNNIFWGNLQSGAVNVAGADIFNNISTNTVTYCLTQQNSSYSSGTGIINNQNPLFVNAADIDGPDNIHRTADDGLRLRGGIYTFSGSPAINAGTTPAPPVPTDILGNARIGAYDMGAYEGGVYLTATLYVDASVSTSGNGTTWATAFKTLPEALAVAHCSTGVGTTIKVATGTYKPTKKPYDGCTEMVTGDPRDITFHLPDWLTLLGGYPAGGGTQNIAANPTILSGDIDNNDTNTDGNNIAETTTDIQGNNAYHVVLASAPSSGGIGVTVDGFSITAGNANVSDLVTVTVNGNYFSGSSGGGIYTFSGTNTLTNNTLSGNSASSRGGGIYTFYGTNTLTNNILSGNAAGNGGGFYTPGGTNTLTNNTLSGNSATYYGGGIYTYYNTNTLTNNTFSGNSANLVGGGIYTHAGGNTLRNNIFWGNLQNGAVNVAGADIYNDFSTITVTYCLTQQNSTYSSGTGIINNQNPLFVNAADIDGPDNIHRTADDGLRLQASSPAINAGTTPAPPVPNDILGNARIAAYDMGAYEDGVCPTATTLYVDASILASGIGTTWATAFKTLPEALAVAHCCTGVDTIKVATGTYKPTKKPYNGCTEMVTGDPRDITFHLPDGLTLRGGYPAGGGTRNIAANPTILSGDFNGDDVVIGSGGSLSITNNTENAYHVVLASAPSSGGIGVTVDGFIITGGNANGPSTFIPVNGNNFFRGYGGGIYTDYGTNTLTNNTLSGNSAVYYGGGIYTLFGTNTLTNNTLSGNSSYYGGGIYTNDGTNTLTNNTLSGNSATFDGGGIYTLFGTNTLTNNTLSGNSATYGGGGIYTDGGMNTLTNNTLSGNSATYGGGGIFTYFATNTLTNNTLSDNSATYYGGGIYTFQGTNTLTNNIFWGNLQGGANNVAGADIYNNFSTNTVTYCLTQQNSSYSSGTGIINNQNPLFVNASDIDGPDNIHRTADDGLRLQAVSPAINAGTTPAPPVPTDILGNARIGAYDMGAYEYFDPCPTATTLYVDASVSTSGNGTTWAAAFKTLPEALAVAHCCTGVDTIKVATGTYKPTKKPYNGCTEMVTGDPRDLTFHLPDGLTLLGGYPAGGGTRNIAANPTILSGDIDNNDTNTDGNNIAETTTDIQGNNAYHVVLASAPSSGGIGVTVDGFIITGGNANGPSTFIPVNGNNFFRGYGGGIYTDYGTNTLTNNTLSGNSAQAGGGGIYTDYGTNTLTNNTLSGNSAQSGGGIYTYRGMNTLTNNTLSGNSAGSIGGGIFTTYGTNTLTNNTLSGNSAQSGGGIFTSSGTYTLTNNTLSGNSSYYGGGIFTEGGTNTLTNNTLSGNSSYYGGGIYTYFATNTLTNNTLSGNSATYGGGIYTLEGTNTLTNNIFWGNLKNGANNVAGADISNQGATNTVTYCLTQQNSTYNSGTGIINNQDPLFVNAADIDGADNIHRTADDGLRLQAGSPAINAGTTPAPPVPTDILGNARIGAYDMGAYEGGVSVCPDLTAAAPPAVVSSQSTCTTGCALSGGVIDTPTTSCPTGSTLQYSTNNGTNWSTNLPTYNQTTAVTVLTRCNCDADTNTSSPTSSVTTVPGVCTPVTASISGTTTGCGSVTLTATGGVSYAWSGGSTPNQAENTFTTSNTYTVTVTDGIGCTASASQVVTVNTLPTAGITNNTGTTILTCTTTAISVTATGGTGYAWSGGATPTIATNSFNTAGTYTVTVTGSGGCTATASIEITGSTLCPDCLGVLGGTALPGTSCNDGNTNTVNDVYSSNCICAGTPVPLDCLGIPGGPAQPGTPCDDGNPDTTDDVFGSNCICAGTPLTALCNLGATLNGNQTICAGNPIVLVATGGNQYQWSGPNGYTATGGSITRTNSNPTMSGTYTVTITNNTCVDVLSIVVTVYPIPSATLSGATPVCSGGTIILTAPAGAAAYQWSGPNGFTQNTGSSNTLSRPNATTAMAGLYKVTVTNAGGCTATASRNISVSAPTVATVTGATSVCGNANVVLTATTVGVAYSWTGPGGFTATTATINTPALAGQYKVTVTSAAGCISTASKTITVTAAPNAAITGNTNVCAGNTIYLIASGGNTYSWSGPGGYTKTGSTVSRPGATVAMSGTYTVTVTGSGGCTATASIVVTVATCKNGEDEKAFETLFAYPNPTNDLTTITFTPTATEQVSLSVFNIEGKEVAVIYDGQVEALTNYEFELDMSRLTPGTYYAVLHPANGQKQQIRLMVVR